MRLHLGLPRKFRERLFRLLDTERRIARRITWAVTDGKWDRAERLTRAAGCLAKAVDQMIVLGPKSGE